MLRTKAALLVIAPLLLASHGVAAAALPLAREAMAKTAEANGNLTTVSYKDDFPQPCAVPSDRLALPTSVNRPFGMTSAVQCDCRLGAPSTMTLGNGVDETTLFNSRLQPTTIEAFKSASLMKLDFTYHPAGQATRNNGNVRSQTINRGGSLIAGQTYTYDGVNRLDLATEGAAWTRDYTYDAFGNRGLTTSGITFDTTNNRITGASYDGAGNLTVMTNVADAMVYDANNKMTSFSLDNGLIKTGDYVYDGQGNRVQRMTQEGSGPQITTTYVYDAFGKLAAEYSSEAQGSTFTRKFRTTDHLGSTRLVTLADGTADPDAGCLDFYPFGERIDDTVGSRTDGCYDGDDAFSQQFTAKERDDESGLDYFGARYFSASLGRFTGPDKPFVDQFVVDPQSWNLYSYTRNNPLKYVDQNGNYIETAWDAANVVIGVKSFIDNVRQGNYGSAAVDAVGVVADSAAVIVPGLPGGAGTVIKGGRVASRAADAVGALNRADNAVDATRAADTAVDAAKRLPDDANVVRGGMNTPESFAKGSGVTVDSSGNLQGVSVNSAPGKSVEQLSEGIPHNKVGVTTVGSVRQAGGDVVPSPTRGNPNHCTMCGVTPQKASDLMDVRPNPAKRRPEDP